MSKIKNTCEKKLDKEQTTSLNNNPGADSINFSFFFEAVNFMSNMKRLIVSTTSKHPVVFIFNCYKSANKLTLFHALLKQLRVEKVI